MIGKADIVLGPYQQWKKVNNYRKSDDRLQRCKLCRFHREGYYRATYLHKCRLLGMSNSQATDIRAGHVCDRFEVAQSDSQEQ